MNATRFATALVFVASLAFGGSASAQQQKTLECPKVDAAKAADAGYKTVSVRRPKVEAPDTHARFPEMVVQVALPVGDARTDAGLDDPKITQIDDCSKSSLGLTTSFHLKVVAQPDWDTTEVVLPETLAKGTKFQSCSKAAKTCFTGTFEGFDKGITLQADSAPTTTAAATKLRTDPKW